MQAFIWVFKVVNKFAAHNRNEGGLEACPAVHPRRLTHPVGGLSIAPGERPNNLKYTNMIRSTSVRQATPNYRGPVLERKKS